jgi:hypothetical protein
VLVIAQFLIRAEKSLRLRAPEVAVPHQVLTVRKAGVDVQTLRQQVLTARLADNVELK